MDNAAPYSGIGIEEFRLIQPLIAPNWNGSFDPLPDSISDRPYWQYGSGQHSSDPRKIIGSVCLTVRSNAGRSVVIRHLVIDGSSQWVIGRNIVRKCNLLYDQQNILQLPAYTDSGEREFIPLIDDDMHSYIAYEMFAPNEIKLSEQVHKSMYCATAQIPFDQNSELSFPKLKKIVDTVHRHVCGHASFSDIKTLLDRNGIWNADTEKYLSHKIETCHSCRHTSNPTRARKVSISTMCRQFNQLVCIDHLFLDDVCVFHAMDSASRYSVGCVVPNTSMEQAVTAFDAHWVSQFWPPEKVLCDPGFKGAHFSDYLNNLNSEIVLLPARRHNKNTIESKHRVLRDIFLRLKSDNPDFHTALLVQQTFRISNSLYGNNLLSAQELAKGYTVPVTPGAMAISIPKELVEAQQKLQAKRKLTLILKSKSIMETPVHAGDMVEVFVKHSNEKRGKWSSPKTVLSYDHNTRTVVLPGRNGRTIQAAIEDIRPSLSDNTLAVSIKDLMDDLDDEIDNEIESVTNDTGKYPSKSKHDANFDLSEGQANAQVEPIENTNSEIQGKSIAVGDKLSVYWPDDKQYYSGTVSRYFSRSGKHKILYDDGQSETLDMTKEIWKHDDSIGETNGISANEIQVVPGKELTSHEKDATDQYHDRFKSKEFFLSEAQDLPSFVTQNAYEREQSSFMKTVQEVHVSKIPPNSNIISSHVLYKVKTLDDGSRIVKARIARHGNRDKDKHLLRTDSATCPPLGLRILLSICTIFRWSLAKVDVRLCFRKWTRTSSLSSTGPSRPRDLLEQMNVRVRKKNKNFLDADVHFL